MAFDDVLLKYVGECGLYQCLIVLLLMLIVTPESPDTMEMVYTQATPLFWPKGQSMGLYLLNSSIAVYLLRCKETKKIFTMPTYKLLLSFMVISDV